MYSHPVAQFVVAAEDLEQTWCGVVDPYSRLKGDSPVEACGEDLYAKNTYKKVIPFMCSIHHLLA